MSQTPGQRLEVTSYEQLQDVSSKIDDREIEIVKSLLNNELEPGSDESIVWLPEFIRRGSDLEPVDGSEELFICSVEDYSEDAWGATQQETETEFLAKSWAVIFDSATSEELESSQKGLTSWAK